MAWEERIHTIEKNGKSESEQTLLTWPSLDNNIKVDVVVCERCTCMNRFPCNGHSEKFWVMVFRYLFTKYTLMKMSVYFTEFFFLKPKIATIEWMVKLDIFYKLSLKAVSRSLFMDQLVFSVICWFINFTPILLKWQSLSIHWYDWLDITDLF